MNQSISRERLKSILLKSDIPILLMVLMHLTNDSKWIKSPYLPKRDLSFFPDESGGLLPEIQEGVVDSACDVLLNLSNSTGNTTDCNLSEETLLEMMSVCVGENVPEEYLTMMLEEMGFKNRDSLWRTDVDTDSLRDFGVLVVGAGMSGLCAAMKLSSAGIPLTIVEKNTALGGTWHENVYPGVGCDVPNHFYSYSFCPNPNWTEYFSKGSEIHEYFTNCAKDSGLFDQIRFNTEVVSAQYDRRSSTWTVNIQHRDGHTTTETYNIVVFALGQMNRPKLPDIVGAEKFLGPAFHTARWPHDVSLKNKNVAVIGTGASAMQLAREVAIDAKRLMIFQRDAQWTIPTRDYHKTVSDEKRWLLNNVPYYSSWYRFGLVWRYGDRLLDSVRIDPEWPNSHRSLNERNDRHRQALTEYMQSELKGRADLLEKSIPTYPPYGKRILVDNDWFKTLKRDNVDLVTDKISSITDNSIVTDSCTTYKTDVIIYATGFQASQSLGTIKVNVKGGPALNDIWGDDNPKAYLGMSVPNFPNLFFLYGPNTNLGHGGSIIFVVECQVRYISSLIMRMIENNFNSLECRQDTHDQYNEKVDKEHAQLVWGHPKVKSWYRNKKGRVFSIMPWRLVDYWKYTREPRLEDFFTS